MDLSASAAAQAIMSQDAGSATREQAARLEGVLLAARTMEHHLGNQLTATAGYSELLLASPDLPPQLRLYAEKAFQGAHEATETVRRLQQLTRVEEDQSIAGVSILDLAGTEPAPAT